MQIKYLNEGPTIEDLPEHLPGSVNFHKPNYTNVDYEPIILNQKELKKSLHNGESSAFKLNCYPTSVTACKTIYYSFSAKIMSALFAVQLLLINVMTNLSSFASMEWHMTSIATAMMLLNAGVFVIGINEWNGQQGGRFYVGADAQNRLMTLLLSTPIVGIQVSTLMQQVVNWFDCLWAAEVSRLSIPLHPGARPALAAAVAPHWMRAQNGQPVYVPSSGMLQPVWI
jgi:hypothetical protein